MSAQREHGTRRTDVPPALVAWNSARVHERLDGGVSIMFACSRCCCSHSSTTMARSPLSCLIFDALSRPWRRNCASDSQNYSTGPCCLRSSVPRRMWLDRTAVPPALVSWNSAHVHERLAGGVSFMFACSRCCCSHFSPLWRDPYFSCSKSVVTRRLTCAEAHPGVCRCIRPQAESRRGIRPQARNCRRPHPDEEAETRAQMFFRRTV